MKKTFTFLLVVTFLFSSINVVSAADEYDPEFYQRSNLLTKYWVDDTGARMPLFANLQVTVSNKTTLGFWDEFSASAAVFKNSQAWQICGGGEYAVNKTIIIDGGDKTVSLENEVKDFMFDPNYTVPDFWESGYVGGLSTDSHTMLAKGYYYATPSKCLNISNEGFVEGTFHGSGSSGGIITSTDEQKSTDNDIYNIENYTIVDDESNGNYDFEIDELKKTKIRDLYKHYKIKKSNENIFENFKNNVIYSIDAISVINKNTNNKNELGDEELKEMYVTKKLIQEEIANIGLSVSDNEIMQYIDEIRTKIPKEHLILEQIEAEELGITLDEYFHKKDVFETYRKGLLEMKFVEYLTDNGLINENYTYQDYTNDLLLENYTEVQMLN